MCAFLEYFKTSLDLFSKSQSKLLVSARARACVRVLLSFEILQFGC